MVNSFAALIHSLKSEFSQISESFQGNPLLRHLAMLPGVGTQLVRASVMESPLLLRDFYHLIYMSRTMEKNDSPISYRFAFKRARP